MPETDEEISYETARDELVGIVQKLEAGGIGLADALTLWERGEKLADICQQWLDGARARLQAVSALDDDGDDNAGDVAAAHAPEEAASDEPRSSSEPSEPSDSEDT